MTIEAGDRLPEATFYIVGDSGVEKRTTREVFEGRKVVFIGVPGAFTPTCHRNHVPGFVENADAILERADALVVMAVNDPHVMAAWGKASGAGDRILFLSDGNAEFTRAAGLEADRSASGMGTRTRRFAMIVEDGIVRSIGLDDVPGQIAETSAARILEQL